MMKRMTWLAIYVLIATLSVAQTQKGYVKTVGKPNKNGVALKNVLIKVSGNTNTILSNDHGIFSFPVVQKYFKFNRVSLIGYELADQDFPKYGFAYTPDAPITIAMISKEDLRQEREAIEARTREKVTTKFQKQLDVLEAKLDEKKLTTDEYKQQYLILQNKFYSMDSLISILSDRYARIDYDFMDSARMEIVRCIENGELEQAQRLIAKKGDINQRTKELEETRKLRIQLQQKENKDREDIATDLYQLHEIYYAKHDRDSAYIYLQKRYELDTTQTRYLADVALFINPFIIPLGDRNIEQQKQIKTHEGYLLKLLNLVKEDPLQAKLINANEYEAIAYVEHGLGQFYSYLNNYEAAIKHFQEEYKMRVKYNLKNEAIPLSNIGQQYYRLEDYNQAIAYFEKAIIYQMNNPRLFQYLANCYYSIGKYEKAMEKYKKAEKEYCLANDSSTYTIRNLYALQGFIAENFLQAGQETLALEYYDKAIANAELYFTLNKESRNLTIICNLLKKMQDICSKQQQHEKALTYAEKSWHYAKLYMERFPSSSNKLFYAEILSLLADAHAHLNRKELVVPELIESLKMGETASNIYKTRYLQLTYSVYCTFATYYAKQNELQKALLAIDKAINVQPDVPTAYQRKLGILASMDDIKGMRTIKNKLVKLQQNHPKELTNILSNPKNHKLYSYNSAVYNPIWDYSVHYLY